MNLTRDRIRSIGWAFVLTVCVALTVALTLRVNAVKGQVHKAESEIVALKQNIGFLEVEFQARSSQKQLAALNAVEFGYRAPDASQYIEGERQLAAFGQPRLPGAPSPIRMANAASGAEARPLVAMVSPVAGVGEASGGPRAAAKSADPAPAKEAGGAADIIGSAITDAKLGQRLARAELAGSAGE